jgi:two-component system, NarL family, response regulator NreC
LYPQAHVPLEVRLGKRKTRCLLAHNHVLLRQGMRRLLEDEADLEVIAEAGGMADALRLASLHRPDVVVSDVAISGPSPYQAEQMIRSAAPQTQVVFLAVSETDDPSWAVRAPRLNVIPRNASAQELVEMIRRTCDREKANVAEMPRPSPEEPRPTQPRKILTARERQVLELLAEGKTVRSVAAILRLSVKTVDAHKFNLMRKLGIHNKAELVMWAIQKRIVKLPANF